MPAGVEAHTIVRDQLTSQDEQAAIREGRLKQGSLRSDATSVDAMVSTIGFPLVGGPAGRSSPTCGQSTCLLLAAPLVYSTSSLMAEPLTSGTMEGGRQADIAKGILAAKNVPYIVAAPLLIQV